MARIIHYLNQFFAQIGGEEKAGQEVLFLPRPVGVGTVIYNALQKHGLEYATIACGDNYFHEQEQNALKAIEEVLGQFRPDLFVAGPAFHAGRYGLACAKLCSWVQEYWRIPTLTGMFEENPGTKEIGRHVLVIQTGSSVAGMQQTIGKFIQLIELLLANNSEGVKRFKEENCLQIPRRFTVKSGAPDYVRAVDLLLAKMKGLPYESEIPFLEVAQHAIPAPVKDMSEATLAIVTEGGLVPMGNPDRLESTRGSRFFKYFIHGRDDLRCGEFEAMHTGYDTSTVNQDPDRLVPLDGLRALERKGRFKKLQDFYLVTTGTGAMPSKMEEIGIQIADELIRANTQGVILTAT